MHALPARLLLTRLKIADGGTTASALAYCPRRCGVLMRFLVTGNYPSRNNHIKNQIRLIAIGRNNWLFAGSLREGTRRAAVMSLI